MMIYFHRSEMQGRTPLHLLAPMRDPQVVGLAQMILSRDAHINARNKVPPPPSGEREPIISISDVFFFAIS